MKLMNQTILLTGGTGSFGKAFIKHMLTNKKFKGVIRVYSRDEFKQHNLALKYSGEKRLRFFIGDVRDIPRTRLAAEDADIIIHAAALKQIPILEYNPFEAIKTNILGAQNVIDAAISTGVKKVILISSDKAVSPINLYGATKMVAEKLFVDANSIIGKRNIKFSVVRYGNVVGSRGSVIPIFLKQAEKGVFTITNDRMTRFWITLEQGIKLVLDCIERMVGGEIFIPKVPSMKIVDLARVISPKAKLKTIGIRPGEKIHEVLISVDEARHARSLQNHFVIFPEFRFNKRMAKIKGGKKLPNGFYYSSENNKEWLDVSTIKTMLEKLEKSYED